MQTSVKRVAEARRRLSALSRRVPTVQAAADTGIHQSQVSRLFRGQFKRLSPNVQTLLDYAKRPRDEANPAAEREAAKSAVVNAALRTWDSTPTGAQALVRLLRSVESLRRLRGTTRR